MNFVDRQFLKDHFKNPMFSTLRSATNQSEVQGNPAAIVLNDQELLVNSTESPKYVYISHVHFTLAGEGNLTVDDHRGVRLFGAVCTETASYSDVIQLGIWIKGSRVRLVLNATLNHDDGTAGLSVTPFYYLVFEKSKKNVERR